MTSSKCFSANIFFRIYIAEKLVLINPHSLGFWILFGKNKNPPTISCRGLRSGKKELVVFFSSDFHGNNIISHKNFAEVIGIFTLIFNLAVEFNSPRLEEMGDKVL